MGAGAGDDETEVVRLDIILAVDDFAGVFDQLEIWRSLSGESGPYAEVTAVAWMGARLPASGGDRPSSPVTGPSAALVGKDLTFLVNGLETLTVTLTGSDPLTRAQVATQLTLGAISSYVDGTGQLVVGTVQPGSGATLELTAGSAAGDLGLPLGDVAYGREPRLALMSSRTRYGFLDQRGRGGAFYKTRFRNRLTVSVSDFSQGFGRISSIGISPELVATGSLDLIDVQGRPLAHREVRIHTEFNGILIDGKLMGGTSITLQTNDDGHLDVVLVRGQKVTVAVLGTDLVRDIVVPTDPNVVQFSLFDPTLAGPDVFRVQVPNLVYAERRSL